MDKELWTASVLWTLGALLIILLAAFPTMWIWNWLMPSIFNLRQIDIWETLGLQFLATVFLKGYVRTR